MENIHWDFFKSVFISRPAERDLPRYKTDENDKDGNGIPDDQEGNVESRENAPFQIIAEIVRPLHLTSLSDLSSF